MFMSRPLYVRARSQNPTGYREERRRSRGAGHGGLWTGGWIGTRAIGREQAARTYVPGEDVGRVIDVIEAAASNPDCPIQNDFEGPEYWPPCWAVVYDPEQVRRWILRHDEDVLPLDLEE